MAKKKTTKNSLDVDKGLVAMFLKMSPEERLQANDNAARTIQRDSLKILYEVARPLSCNLKGGYHINCPFGYVGRGLGSKLDY